MLTTISVVTLLLAPVIVVLHYKVKKQRKAQLMEITQLVKEQSRVVACLEEKLMGAYDE